MSGGTCFFSSILLFFFSIILVLMFVEQNIRKLQVLHLSDLNIFLLLTPLGQSASSFYSPFTLHFSFHFLTGCIISPASEPVICTQYFVIFFFIFYVLNTYCHTPRPYEEVSPDMFF